MARPNTYLNESKKVVKHSYEYNNERVQLAQLEAVFDQARAAARLDIPFTITTTHTMGNRKGGDYDYDIYAYAITFDGVTEVER